jgi:hypothetical protein
MVEHANYFQYNLWMVETLKRRSSGNRHPPGYYRTYKRPDPCGLTVHFTKAEYEMLQRRAEQDGTTRHAVAKRLLLNYAKNGLGDG